jgi:hypothetical protein
MTGGVLSIMLIAKEPEVIIPLESITEQLTSAVPSLKKEPDAGMQTGFGAGLSSASVADTV